MGHLHVLDKVRSTTFDRRPKFFKACPDLAVGVPTVINNDIKISARFFDQFVKNLRIALIPYQDVQSFQLPLLFAFFDTFIVVFGFLQVRFR